MISYINTEHRNGGIPSLNKYELLEQFPSDIHCRRNMYIIA